MFSLYKLTRDDYDTCANKSFIFSWNVTAPRASCERSVFQSRSLKDLSILKKKEKEPNIYFRLTQDHIRYSIFPAFVTEQRTVNSANAATVVTHYSSKRSKEASHFNQPLLLPGTLCWLWVCIPCLHGNRHVIGRSKGAFGISNQVAVWLLFCLAILLFACWDLAP